MRRGGETFGRLDAVRASTFPDAWYEPWCRLYLGIRGHATRLAEWFGQQRYATAAYEPELSVSTLDSALAGLGATSPNGRQLAAAHACLRALERRYATDAQSATVGQALKEVHADGRRHVLLRPLRQSFRPLADAPDRFKVESEIGTEAVLELDYRWLEMPADTGLALKALADLDALRGESTLRIGLAPLASNQDMNWHVDAFEARQPDGRVPVCCGGAKLERNLAQTLEGVLEAAWNAKVHILVLPELVVDEALLQCCRDWLQRHNFREVRLRLVVAGSLHLADPRSAKDFFNRCTVLGYDGETLWQQDKFSPFVMDDSASLTALCPGANIAKLFEPTRLGRDIILAEMALGRLLTPICLDYIEGTLWGELGADVYLVPAMTERLSRFQVRAHDLGARHGAASFVCNAQTTGDHRILGYLPAKGAPRPVSTSHLQLFTMDAPLYV